MTKRPGRRTDGSTSPTRVNKPDSVERPGRHAGAVGCRPALVGLLLLTLSACGTPGAKVAAQAPAVAVVPQAPAPRAVSAPPAVAVPAVPATPAPPPGGAEAESPADPAGSVYFAFAGTRVDAAGMEVLRRNAVRLKKDPRQVVTLVGYADPVGSRSYNLAIAEERLDAVSEALRSLGVAAKQIRRQSPGRAKDAHGGTSPACRREMRRVELVYGQ